MIDFKNVYKSYGGQDLLLDASFRINKNEHVGIVGPNGAGKSTIFAIITGEAHADRGEIIIPDNMRMAYLRQHLRDFDKNLSLLDYTSDAIPELKKISDEIHSLEGELASNSAISDKQQKLQRLGTLQSSFEALGAYRLKNEAEKALSGLGFSEDAFAAPLTSFSGGWQMRANLARILISNPDILLLDEPSNYLDIPAVEWLYRFLKSYEGTLLLISHDRFLLKTLTDITIEVNSGKTTRYPGDYDYYARERANRIAQLEAAKENQDKKKEQLERSIERFRAKSSKASQVQSWIKTVEKMEEINLPDKLNYTGQIRIPPAPHSGHEIIRLENASFSYDGDRWIFQDLDLRIERGQKVGIVGYNGRGKTTLLRVLAGRLPLNKGARGLGHKVIIGYQAQDFGEIFSPGKTVFEIVKNAAPPTCRSQNVRTLLGSFGFSGENVEKQCEVLSGGEKIRLAFASIFINPPNFLILDEPTTHLDISALETLQNAIRNYDGTVCIVSHDIEFIRNSADTIIALESSGIKKYPGNFDYYREKTLNAENERKNGENTASASSSDSPKARRQERALKRLELIKVKRAVEKEISAIEAGIGKLEAEKKKIVDIFSSAQENIDFASLNKQSGELEKSIAEATKKWEEAAEKLESINLEYDKIHKN